MPTDRSWSAAGSLLALRPANITACCGAAGAAGRVGGLLLPVTLGEPGSAGFAVHAHYFLFSGSTMHVLVLQALPDTEFTELAPTFDRIAHSYRVPVAQSGPPRWGAPPRPRRLVRGRVVEPASGVAPACRSAGP